MRNDFPDIAPILLQAVAKQIVDERREAIQLWGKSDLPDTFDRCLALAAERIRAMVEPAPPVRFSGLGPVLLKREGEPDPYDLADFARAKSTQLPHPMAVASGMPIDVGKVVEQLEEMMSHHPAVQMQKRKPGRPKKVAE
jgi:hypothetical protein